MEEKDQVQDESVENLDDEVVEVEEVMEEESGNEEQKGTAEDSSELDKLKQEKDELYQRILRVQAEYDNFRKRTQKEKEADRKYKSQDIVTELLPALDNFERALQLEVKGDSVEKFVEGMQMVQRQLRDAFSKHGVEEIEAKGQTFDPHLHQAVMQVEEEEYDSNVVVEVLQKGYKLKDRVIRPAMVKVNQ